MIRRILVPTDGYGLEDHVISYVARAFPFAEFYVVSVVNTYERGVQLTNLLYEEMRKSAENAVVEAKAKLESYGVHDIKSDVLEGLPSKEIVHYAKSHEIDLIAIRVYSRKHTASAHRLGSTVRNVLRKSTIPVLTVAEECNKIPPKKLLLLTDGTGKSKMAENFAILMASSYRMDIRVLFLMEGNYDNAQAEKIMKNLEWKAEFWGVKIGGEIVEKSMNDVIRDISASDLVIMGVGKRRFIGCKIGHMAQYIATHSPVPVIFVGKSREKRWSKRILSR